MKRIFEIVLFVVLAIIAFSVVKNKLAAFYFNQGNDSYEKNLYNDAQNYLGNSLRINPGNASAHYVLANVYNAQGQEESAIKEYQEALRLDNKYVAAYKGLVYIYLAQQRSAAALELLDKAKTLLPADLEIKQLIDESTLELVTHLLNSGSDLFVGGNKAKAYRLVNEAVEVNPKFPFSHYILAYFYYVDKDYDKAEASLSESIRQDNGFSLAHKLKGDIYFSKKLFKEAIYEYQAALSLRANDPVILNDVALAFMNMESYEDAITFLRKAVSLEPHNVTFRYNLACLYKDAGRLGEAAFEYDNIISAQTDLPGVYNGLGDIYKTRGLLQQASEQYQKEITLCQNKLLKDPGNVSLLVFLAHAYNGTGEFNKAKDIINEVLAVKPDNGDAYLILAEIYKNLNKPEDSLSALEKARKLSSGKYSFIDNNIDEISKLKSLPKNK